MTVVTGLLVLGPILGHALGMVTTVMSNVSRSFCHQAPSAGGGGAGRRSIFDGDKFDIFREGAEGQETAALFSRSVQQGKGEPHDSIIYS